MSDKGKIVFLNGVSSAGKTTLAKTLQDRLPELYYRLDVDDFVNMSITRRKPIDPKTYFPVGKDPISVTGYTIKFFADLGINVIADHGLFRPEMVAERNTLNECVNLLNNYDVLFVHVVCPLEELRRREKERGNRMIGESERRLAEFNYYNAKYNVNYDITVDTFHNTTEECSNMIMDLLKYPERFTAFKQLWSQQQKHIE